MKRFFNTAGPVHPGKHYMIPMKDRLDLDEILMLIQQEKYFILHAPRQTGKTSALLALMEHLNKSGEYRALYVNVEPAQAAREDVAEGIKAILGGISHHAEIYLNDPYPNSIYSEILEKTGPFEALKIFLSQWSAKGALPLILFIDEIDSLVGDTLISVLRQLRAGYTSRPLNFPQSVILCGVRDIRDYRIHSSAEKTIITGGSAFNIKAKSLRLGDFSRPEMERLLELHTAETGQPFAPGTFDLFWYLTMGQPWLVNALAYECCFEKKENRVPSVTITPAIVSDAAESLIRRRETHLDQLLDKLSEKRVRKVIQPILLGEAELESIPEDDVQYVEDLGLIRRFPQFEIANPIYREVIPRALINTTQNQIAHQTEWYVKEEGTLDIPKLLDAFQQFFREHSEHWLERFDYREAGPQLLIQAFLQRIVNGGGRVEREYALGRKRSDLLVIWPYGKKQTQRIVIELKLRKGDLEELMRKGAEQTFGYMDKCGAAEGYLVIFDKSKGKTWEERIFQNKVNYEGREIRVWGM